MARVAEVGQCRLGQVGVGQIQVPDLGAQHGLAAADSEESRTVTAS